MVDSGEGMMTTAATNAETVPRPQRRRTGEFRLPRGLLLWWSLWLLASWIQAFVWYRSSVPTVESYGRTVRIMLLSVGLGVGIVWPMFRLGLVSRTDPRRVRRMAVMDWLAVVSTVQVVLWPIRLYTQWDAARILLLDATIASWSVLVAGIIAMGAARTEGWSLAWWRGMWMGVCVGLAMVGPAAAMFFEARGPGTIDAAPGGAGGLSAIAAEAAYWSPVSSLWMLSDRTSLYVSGVEWVRPMIVSAAGVLVWGAAGMGAGVGNGRRRVGMGDGIGGDAIGESGL